MYFFFTETSIPNAVPHVYGSGAHSSSIVAMPVAGSVLISTNNSEGESADETDISRSEIDEFPDGEPVELELIYPRYLDRRIPDTDKEAELQLWADTDLKCLLCVFLFFHD